MIHRRTLRLAPLILLSLTGGCEYGQGVPSSAPGLTAPAQPATAAAIPAAVADAYVDDPRRNGPVSETAARSVEPLVQLGTAGAVGGVPARAGSPTGDEGSAFTFVETDIREIAKTILGDILKVNYTIDPNVRGTATLDTAKPIPRADLVATLTMLLKQNGAALVQRNGTYMIVPASAVSGIGALPPPGDPTSGSEVVPLRYTAAQDLAKVLEPYAAETGRVIADPTRNALLVSGDGPARASLISLIHAFDINLLANQSYALFPVPSGEPRKAAAELQKVLATEGSGRLAGLIRVVPMERTNAVLVISPQARYLDDVRRLYKLLDQAEGRTARSWHIYYVQNGDCTDFARVLRQAFALEKESSAQSTTPGSTAPGFDSASLSSASTKTTTGTGGGSASGGSASGGSGGTTGQPATAGTDQRSAEPDKSRAATDSLSSGGQDDQEGSGKNAVSVRIIANKFSNAVLIYATPDEYDMAEAILNRVDLLPLQVMIEATIAEVTLNDNLQYGTQFFFQGKGINGELSTATSGSVTATGTGTFGGTFPAFVLNKNIGAVTAALSALQAVTDVKVLSSPQILVLNNEAAQLSVGDQVPVITQTATSTLTSTSQVVNSVDYHSTGVILQVVPRVNSSGLVTLSISQEVSDVVNTTSSTIDSPTFEERKVKSRVVVQDGQTIGLAGLIRDTASRENAGIPWLKDIPVLGALASSQDNTRTRTELLVLLTPRVVRDQRTARALTDDLRTKLWNADMVPAEKAALPPSGSANPNAAFAP